MTEYMMTFEFQSANGSWLPATHATRLRDPEKFVEIEAYLRSQAVPVRNFAVKMATGT